MKLSCIFLSIATAMLVTGAEAQPAPAPASKFMTTFAGLCVRRFGDLEALRVELKGRGLPELQEAAARAFLDGHPGDAWPVPESGVLGNMVLALPSDHYQCTLFARRGVQSSAEAGFAALASHAPPPFVSELKTDEHSNVPASGDTHTLAYLWKVEGGASGVALFLTTASSARANLQLKATATRVSTP